MAWRGRARGLVEKGGQARLNGILIAGGVVQRWPWWSIVRRGQRLGDFRKAASLHSVFD